MKGDWLETCEKCKDRIIMLKDSTGGKIGIQCMVMLYNPFHHGNIYREEDRPLMCCKTAKPDNCIEVEMDVPKFFKMVADIQEDIIVLKEKVKSLENLKPEKVEGGTAEYWYAQYQEELKKVKQ